ncbi:MAG: AI-2E family transporter [Actinomycetota bacterium]
MPEVKLHPKTVFMSAIVVAAAGLLLYVGYRIRGILLLVVIAAFLAISLEPAVEFLQKLRFPRGAAVAAILLATIVFAAGFFVAVVPPLSRQVQNLAHNIPTYTEKLTDYSKRFQEYNEKYQIADKIKSTLEALPSKAGAYMGNVAGVALGFLRVLANTVTVLVLTIYFLLDAPRLKQGMFLLLPKRRRKRAGELVEQIFDKVGGFMMGNILVSIVAGTAAFIALSIMRVPYPVALALWVAIADMIPMVGATLGAIICVIVALFQGPLIGLLTLIYFVIYQQTENYLLVPRIMKKTVDLSPAAVILAAMIGGTLAGFAGVLLAVPAAAAVKLLTQELWMKQLEENPELESGGAS